MYPVLTVLVAHRFCTYFDLLCGRAFQATTTLSSTCALSNIQKGLFSFTHSTSICNLSDLVCFVFFCSEELLMWNSFSLV